MKKILIILLLFFLFVVSVFSQSYSAKDLIGKWIGTAQGKAGSLEFLDSSHVNVMFPDGTFIKGTYAIDFTKKPIWIDIINIKGNQKATLEGLIKFIDKTSFRWMITHSGTRPKDFSPNKNTSTLTFKKKNISL
jgi:hypothetical protein